jgi:hypothetical protein
MPGMTDTIEWGESISLVIFTTTYLVWWYRKHL